MSDDLLTVKQVAERAGVSVATVRAYHARGWIQAAESSPFPRNGSVYLFEPSAVEVLREKHARVNDPKRRLYDFIHRSRS